MRIIDTLRVPMMRINIHGDALLPSQTIAPACFNSRKLWPDQTHSMAMRTAALR